MTTIAVLAVLAPAPVRAQGPSESTEEQRVAGDGREATAAAINVSVYDTADTVVIVRGDLLADALAAGPLAAAVGAPVLLAAREGLSAATAEEVTRLGAVPALVIGGESAVPPIVVEELGAAGLGVRRIAGASSFDTAAQVATEVVQLAEARTVMLVRGTGSGETDFADAVAVSALAARTGSGILPTGQRDGGPLQTVWVASGPTVAEALAAGPAAAMEGAGPLLVDGQALGADQLRLEALARLLVDISSLRLAGGTAALTGPVARTLATTVEGLLADRRRRTPRSASPATQEEIEGCLLPQRCGLLPGPSRPPRGGVGGAIALPATEVRNGQAALLADVRLLADPDVDGGCVGDEQPDGVRRSLIWPPKYAVPSTDAGFDILDQDGNVFGDQDDRVAMGGGFNEVQPDRCNVDDGEGRTWVAGSVRLASPDQE